MPSPEPDHDEIILQLLAAGEVRVIDKLHELYYERLFFSIRKFVRHDHDAATLINDLLLSIWEKRDRLTLRKPLLYYLYRAARNRALNFMRDQGRLKEIPVPDELLHMRMAEASEDPSGMLMAEDLQLLWSIAELQMPFRVRQTFLLSRQEGKTKEEIAAAMGITVNAVEKNMARALRLIEKTWKLYFGLLAPVSTLLLY